MLTSEVVTSVRENYHSHTAMWVLLMHVIISHSDRNPTEGHVTSHSNRSPTDVHVIIHHSIRNFTGHVIISHSDRNSTEKQVMSHSNVSPTDTHFITSHLKILKVLQLQPKPPQFNLLNSIIHHEYRPWGSLFNSSRISNWSAVKSWLRIGCWRTSVCIAGGWTLTHWGQGHLNCLNASSRGLNNLNQLLYCVSLKIYNKFANYFCELKFSGNTHQRP